MGKHGQHIKLNVKVAWWLRWYLVGVALMCGLTKCEPDISKVKYWINKAIKIKAD